MFTCPACGGQLEWYATGDWRTAWNARVTQMCACGSSHMSVFRNGAFTVTVHFQDLRLDRTSDVDGESRELHVDVDGRSHALRSPEIVERMAESVMRQIRVQSVMSS